MSAITYEMRSDRRQAVWNKTCGRCWYCGALLVSDRASRLGHFRADSMQIDHMTPTWRGGSGRLENLVPCCGYCNPAKGAKSVDEFRLWLMLTAGRPPTAFFGEGTVGERDWLILYAEDGREVPSTPQASRRALPKRLARYLDYEVEEQQGTSQ